MVDTLDMSEKWKMAVDAAQKGGRSEDEAKAYVFAVGALRDTELELKAIGIKPNVRSDALGDTLINPLTDHYSEEHALLSLEEFQAMLKRCYEAGL